MAFKINDVAEMIEICGDYLKPEAVGKMIYFANHFFFAEEGCVHFYGDLNLWRC